MRRDAVGGHKARGNACRWGSNLPNNVAASLDPVVQEGQACVGNEIGEAHVCSWFELIACMEGENRSGVDEEEEESGTVFLVAGDCGKMLAPARAFQLWRLDTFHPRQPHCTSVMHLDHS